MAFILFQSPPTWFQYVSDFQLEKRSMRPETQSNTFYILAGSCIWTPFANMKMGHQRWPEMPLRWLPVVLPLHTCWWWKLKKSPHAQRKTSVFFDFYDVNMSTKSKTDSKFSRVSFGECFKIWRSCNHIPLL